MNDQIQPPKIFTFADLPAALTAQAGGKGAALARLHQAGYPVPAGFVILPTAFAKGQLTDTAWNHLQSASAALAADQVAVRSSALGEDGATTSFAGEFETVLNVPVTAATSDRSTHPLWQAIHHVYASRQNERVLAYAAAQGVTAPTALAVVVQKMVPAEYAGVLFSADPVQGDANVMTGNFVAGLGERLVSGEADAASFTLKQPKGAYEGPDALRPYARRLFRLGQQLTADLGGHQDIEWAVAGGRLYLLQARPITTMQAYDPVRGDWNDSRRGQYLWSNSNFGEAIPGVMTPLTWSHIQIFGVEILGNPFPGNHPFMGNIGGRFYANLSLFASLFQALGMGRERLKVESEPLFGNIPDDLPIPTIQFSRWALLRRFVPYAVKAMLRRRRNMRQLADFTASVPARYAQQQQAIAAAATPAALAKLWRTELEPLLRQGYQMLQAGTSAYENTYRPLQKELAALVGEADANLLLSGVSEAGNRLASLGPVLGLWQIQQGELSRADYRRDFGHRGVHEMELDWQRPDEDPDWLDEQLANLADQDVPALLAKRAAEKNGAWARFQQQHTSQVADIKRKLAAAAAAARGREAIRSEITRLVYLMRQFALRAGALTGLNDDVFYLWLEELLAHLDGAPAPLAAIPARRAAHERLTALPPYPALINGRFDPAAWAADPGRRGDIYDGINPSTAAAPDDENTIIGMAGSAGSVTGRVRRLDDAAAGHLLQPGEILVTTTTNIGWTPLFPRAAAIVTDVGAPLSHAAIVARELGLPAVVGAGRTTMVLQTGDLVRVDGGRGTVERLEMAAEHVPALAAQS